jgi:pyruvate,orthophosphate dikinase
LLQAVQRLHEQNPMLGCAEFGSVVIRVFELRAERWGRSERILAGGRREWRSWSRSSVQEFETVRQDILQVARDVHPRQG